MANSEQCAVYEAGENNFGVKFELCFDDLLCIMHRSNGMSRVSVFLAHMFKKKTLIHLVHFIALFLAQACFSLSFLIGSRAG